MIKGDIQQDFVLLTVKFPAFIHTWISYGCRPSTHFIYNRTNLEPILLECQELGAHTNVIEFKSAKAHTFTWMHPGACPMRVGISHQCIRCSCLRTVKPITGSIDSAAVLKCSVCGNVQTYSFPTGWNWVQGGKGDRQGAWLVRIDHNAKCEDMDTMQTYLFLYCQIICFSVFLFFSVKQFIIRKKCHNN